MNYCALFSKPPLCDPHLRRSRNFSLIYDVMIAGAGPVGLFLACELRQADLSVLVLEQAEDSSSPLKRLPFGMRGLSVPTIEAVYRRGLLNDIAPPKRAKGDSGGAMVRRPRKLSLNLPTELTGESPPFRGYIDPPRLRQTLPRRRPSLGDPNLYGPSARDRAAV